MPSPNVDPYDTYGKYLLKEKQMIVIVLDINFPLSNMFSNPFVQCECQLSNELCFEFVCMQLMFVAYFHLH